MRATTSIFVKNIKLHRQGVLLVNNLVPREILKVQLAPKDHFGCKYPDTDLIIYNLKSGSRYEVRVPTTARTATNPNWLLNEGNMSNSDPNLFYCFTLFDNDQEKPKHKVFVVPSPIVVRYLKSNLAFQKEQGRRPQGHFLSFFLGNKNQKYSPSLEVFFENDFENKWELFK